MGKPWNNESAQKWWACGRHVRQKELAPSAKVRRTTPEVVRAPPRHLLVIKLLWYLKVESGEELIGTLPTLPIKVLKVQYRDARALARAAMARCACGPRPRHMARTRED